MMTMYFSIDNIRPEADGHLYSGSLKALGVWHHACFIKVKDGDLREPLDDAPQDVKDRFADMQAFYEAAYATVELPGVIGRFVMFVFPYDEFN